MRSWLAGWTLSLAALLAGPPVAGQGLEEALAMVAGDLGRALQANETQKLAVVEFSDLSGYESALGLFIAEELTTGLFSAEPGRFDIVERQHLARVLEEQKLTSSSLFEPGAIEKLGQILGIDTLVTGSIADLGAFMKLNVRAISVKTAKVFAAASTRFDKDAIVESLVRQGASPELSGDAGGSARPTRQVQSSDVFFQNDLFRLRIQNLSFQADGRSGSLTLELENLTSSELLLAVELKRQTCSVRVADDRGNDYEPRGSYASGVFGIACLRLDLRDPMLENEFSRFGPKSRSAIVVPLRSNTRSSSRRTEQEPAIGEFFSFSGGFLQMVNGRVRRVAAGVSGIRPSG